MPHSSRNMGAAKPIHTNDDGPYIWFSSLHDFATKQGKKSPSFLAYIGNKDKPLRGRLWEYAPPGPLK